MLAIVRNGDHHGIVGTPTGTVVDGVEVCVGDVVNVAEGKNNHASTNLVAVFGNKFGVMGLAGDPISYHTVTEIVKSHKDVTTETTFNHGYFEVKEFLK